MKRLGSIVGPVLGARRTVKPLSGVRRMGALLFTGLVLGVLLTMVLI